MRGFDEHGHLFGLLVGLHVLLGVVGQIRVASWVPGVKQRSSGLGEGFWSQRKGKPQDLQRMVDVFFTHIGHGTSLAKRMEACQSVHSMFIMPISAVYCPLKIPMHREV